MFSTIYFWGTSISKFTAPFRNNEVLYRQAQTVYHNLEGALWPIFLVGGITLPFVGILAYYLANNCIAGRIYRTKFWIGFFAGTLILSLIATFIIAITAKGSINVDGTWSLIISTSVTNLIVAVIVAFLSSLGISRSNWTNAHKRPF